MQKMVRVKAWTGVISEKGGPDKKNKASTVRNYKTKKTIRGCKEKTSLGTRASPGRVQTPKIAEGHRLCKSKKKNSKKEWGSTVQTGGFSRRT